MTAHLAPPTPASGFAALQARNAAETEARELCAALSEKQRTVLVLASKGLTYAEVAGAMNRARATVEMHCKEGRAVLGAHNMVEAAVLLTKAGLV